MNTQPETPAAGERPMVFRGVVHPWHHDQFGHMNVRWYAHFFDDAAFFCFHEFGLDIAEMQAKHSVHTVTAKSSTSFIRELKAGDLVTIDGGITRMGTKSLTAELRMVHAETGIVHATYETVEVFFDPATRQSTAMPDEIRRHLTQYLVEG